MTVLPHWGRDKMAVIFQTTFLNAFYWMKIYEFHWSLSPGGPINNIPACIVSDNGLVPTRQQVIIWTNDSSFTDAYMCHSASMS